MIQKLPTNSLSIDGLALADILPTTTTTAIATTITTAPITIPTAMERTITSAMATTAAAIIKQLNLSINISSSSSTTTTTTAQNSNETTPTMATMATTTQFTNGLITANRTSSEQLTSMLHKMLDTAGISTSSSATSSSMAFDGLSPDINLTSFTGLMLNRSSDSGNFQSSASLTSSKAPTLYALPEAYNFSTAGFAFNDDNSMTMPITTTMSPTATAYSYLLGMDWPKALIVAIFLVLILVTIVGNTLVILAVLTTRRLRTVTNCFVMNLAITDWLVGTCVMPPSVILYVLGSWQFGWILCDIWISLDVLLCTGSILSLCAISLDRYLAVTQPLTYSKKRRSKRLALFMIFIVWITALSITCPPYLGWYEPGRRQDGNFVCRYNQNKGYVVFSAMGSFFIPLAVMMYVYLKIGYVLTSRRQRIVRDANSERTADHEIDCDNFLSESEHFHCATPKFPSFKNRWTINGSKKNSLKCEKFNSQHTMEQLGLRHQASFYELVEISRLSSLIHCSALSCKYGGTCMHTTPMGVVTLPNGNDIGESNGLKHVSTLPKMPNSLHFSESRASFSETCLTTTTTTSTLTAATTLQQNVKFNAEQQLHQHQQHNHKVHQNQHQHPQQHPHPHRIPMRISTTKRDTKTAKTLTIVMGGFVVCWLPFFVYYLLIPFLPPAAVIEGLQTFLCWVGWVNCAINPFIYAFYNPDFRLAFWRLTCRRICKQKPPPNHMAMFKG